MKFRRRLWKLALALSVTFALLPESWATTKFPLSISPSGRYLVDAAGNPFFIHGDTAWSLMAQLTREDAELYLRDRRERGFNTILVSLIEHQFADNAPRNAYGEAPFLSPGDFSRPNEAYFAHADWVLRRAAEEGLLVLLAPAYAGINGGAEGWYGEMTTAGASALRRYGEFLGLRYREFPNILWVQSGDYNPPDKSLVRGIAEGILDGNPRALQTAHGAPGTASLDHWEGEDWLRLNAVYTYGPISTELLRQRARRERLPYFLFESSYENEHGVTTRRLREQAYQALCYGAAGHIFGNNPIWHFDGPGLYDAPGTWVESLDSDGTRSMSHLQSLVAELVWWKMQPDIDGALVTEGGWRHQDPVAAATADDGSFALIYLPSRRELTVNLGLLAGPTVRARWYDPSRGTFAPAAGSHLLAKGSHRFGKELSLNASGEEDWVLVLQSDQ